MAENKDPAGFGEDGFKIDGALTDDQISDDEFFKKYSFFSGGQDISAAQTDDDSVDISSSSKGLSHDFSDLKKSARKERRKPKKKRSGRSAVLRIILSVFLVGIITAALVVGAFAVYVFVFVDDTIQENLNDLKLDFSTIVYVPDTKTGEYVEYQRLHGEYNRIWVNYNRELALNNDPEYDGIPEQLVDAFISVEDKRFPTHGGVDWKRTLSAFANMFVDIYSSNQGGSTITQQLVKNLTGDDNQSAMRKIREIMRARYIEQNYSKETIIECYLNTISMAGGMYGVEVASNYYFGKSANQLTLAECAALASIARNPERYRPDKNPNDNYSRRKIVLGLMREQGYISDAEYEEAAAQEKLDLVCDKTVLGNAEDNSYFVDALIEQVINDLVEKYGYDKKYASKNFYNGGYKIYATIDTEIQKKLDKVYSDMSHFPVSKKSGARPQSAMTIMDYNGHVVALVGGIGEKTGLREYNRATMSPRQPGSSIKPLSVYAPALEYNLITYSTYYNDHKITISGWSPRNAYGGYYGRMNVARAIEISCNTIAVQTLRDLSLDSSFKFLTENMGITTYEKDSSKDFNYSALGLGGCYTGITTLESAAAYATFGNMGKYYKPTTYVKVTDQHDKIVLNYDSTPNIAMGEDTATIMNKIMQRVIYGSSGTGKNVASFSDKIIAFGKTGTANNYYDRWFVGGTPYYVASCWFGFDKNEKITNSKEVLAIWKAVMQQIHKDLPEKDFPESQFVTRRKYCTDTGLLATANCPNTSIGYYKSSYLPICTQHKGLIEGEVKPPSSVPAGTSSAISGSSQTHSETVTSSGSAASEPTTVTSSEPTPVSTPENTSSGSGTPDTGTDTPGGNETENTDSSEPEIDFDP